MSEKERGSAVVWAWFVSQQFNVLEAQVPSVAMLRVRA